jgi:hypothetical protein
MLMAAMALIAKDSFFLTGCTLTFVLPFFNGYTFMESIEICFCEIAMDLFMVIASRDRAVMT